MTGFYLWTTAIIILLARITLGVTLLHFIYTYSPSHAIVLFATWLVLGISEFNLKVFIENLKLNN